MAARSLLSAEPEAPGPRSASDRQPATAGNVLLPALHNLVTGKFSAATEVIAVVVFVVIDFMLIIIPFAFLELRPAVTKAPLKQAQDWVTGRALRLMAAVVLLLGASLTVSGLVRLS
jgi:Sap, sulfolipid-1-addressing protein